MFTIRESTQNNRITKHILYFGLEIDEIYQSEYNNFDKLDLVITEKQNNFLENNNIKQ